MLSGTPNSSGFAFFQVWIFFFSSFFQVWAFFSSQTSYLFSEWRPGGVWFGRTSLCNFLGWSFFPGRGWGETGGLRTGRRIRPARRTRVAPVLGPLGRASLRRPAPPRAVPGGARAVGGRRRERTQLARRRARAGGRGLRGAAAGSPPGEGLARPAFSFRRAAATSRAGPAAVRRQGRRWRRRGLQAGRASRAPGTPGPRALRPQAREARVALRHQRHGRAQGPRRAPAPQWVSSGTGRCGFRRPLGPDPTPHPGWMGKRGEPAFLCEHHPSVFWWLEDLSSWWD